MDSKTLSVLEYPKILERLAAHCAFSASADLARKLEPSTHLDEVQRLQAETSEARRLIAAAEASIGGAHDVRPAAELARRGGVIEASIGGAHDVRPAAELARRGGVIEPTDMLDIKSTLISARNLKKAFEKTSKGETEKSPSSPALSRSTLEGPPQGEGSPLSRREKVRVREKTHAPENPYPRLSEIALGLPSPLGLVDAISRTLSDRGEVLDSASPKLLSLLGLPSPLGLVDAISRTLSDRGEVLDSASPKLLSLRREIRAAHDRLMTRLQKYITDSRTASMLQEAIITQRDGRYVLPLRAEFKGRIKAIIHDQSSSAPCARNSRGASRPSSTTKVPAARRCSSSRSPLWKPTTKCANCNSRSATRNAAFWRNSRCWWLNMQTKLSGAWKRWRF